MTDPSVHAAPTSNDVPGAARHIVLVAHDRESALGAATIATRLARARGTAPVLTWVRAEADDAEANPAAVEHFRGGDDALASFQHHVADDLESALEDATSEWPGAVLVLAATADWPEARPLNRLVASPPLRLLVLFRSDEASEPHHVLVATNTFAPLSQEEREMAFTIAAGDATERVDFLRMIDDDVAGESETIRSALLERVAQTNPSFAYDVIVRNARAFEAGILEVINEAGPYDLVVVDAPRQGLVGRLSERVIPRRLVRSRTPVLLYSAPVSPLGRTFMAAWNVVYGLVPSPTEAERVNAYTRVRRNSRGNADFHVLMALAVLIAAFGLLLDSPAVVIGAMIVAPLMQPVLGVGLGVATANGKLTRIAAGSLVRGIIIAVAAACLIGLVVPNSGVTGELNARGQPTVLDLLVALASGAAGAYATARKGAANSAAGVAIAVALVPPLATVGIGIALGERSLAIGAALLFTTNVTAIGAMSAMMFLWMGFKPTAGRFGGLSALVQGLATLAAMVLVVAFFIVARSKASDASFEREVFAVTEIAVQGVDPEAELESVLVEKRGDVLIVTGRVDAQHFSTVAGQVSIVQSDVTRQLGRPTVMLFVPVLGD